MCSSYEVDIKQHPIDMINWDRDPYYSQIKYVGRSFSQESLFQKTAQIQTEDIPKPINNRSCPDLSNVKSVIITDPLRQKV